ncbi:EthD family reductase [Sporosarcina sp. BP05]|uniref:EthD family reductase n=1 Tax=Sporosarcina sp. BP05 TaxID=2758726 RepID=UPI0021035C8A|nr:EthD family reductase [Sporosarcina sp. BP05]
MAKMIIMYEQPKDIVGFEEHYFNVHVPLGLKIPNIIKDSVHHVIQSQNTNLELYMITVLEFESIQKLTEALASPEARAAEEDGVNLFKYVNPPIITIVN